MDAACVAATFTGESVRLEKKTLSATTVMNVDALPRATWSSSTIVEDDAPVMLSPLKRAGMEKGAVVWLGANTVI